MKMMKDYTLDNKCIVQTKKPFFNAVDSNFLTCNTYYIQSNHLNLSIEEIGAITKFAKKNKIVRYPNNSTHSSESLYWANPKTVSRDNSIGFLIATSEILKDYSFCIRFCIDTLLRLSFFQNTHTVNMKRKFLPDFCGLGCWSILLRTTNLFRSFIFTPAFMILDVFYMFSIITFIIRNKYFDNDYNSPLYHMISSVIYMAKVNRNPVSIFNKWLLLTKCPFNKKYPRSAYFGITGVESQLMEYSRAHYDPPIYTIYENYRRYLK